MKTSFLIIVLLFSMVVCKAQESQKARIRVTYNLNGDSLLALKYAEDLYYHIFHMMKKDFPCVSFVDDQVIRLGLNQQRELQLVGAGSDQALKDFSKNAVNVDYYIFLKTIITQSGIVTVTAVFRDAKTKDDLSDCYFLGDVSTTTFTALEKPARQLVDGLRNVEICPYKGPIKIEVLSDLFVDVKNEYPVFCNEQDRTYKISYRENKHSKNIWNFEKTTRVYARTFVDYNISEETEKIVDDGCYPCPSGKTKRYFRQTISKTGRIDKVSEESQLFGKRLNDARIEIKFADDGTYTIKVDAASAQADITTTINQQAESWCDENVPIKTIKHKTDIGLTYIFGPYKGLATDEVLAQNPDPIVIVNPISKEKTTYNVSFNLKKE